MNNILSLLIFIPSFAFAVNDGDFSIELTGFGASYHFVRTREVESQPTWVAVGEPLPKEEDGWNELNWGLGTSFVFHAERNFDVSFNMGTYKDSYNDDAIFALVGFRKIFGDRNGWNVSIGPYLGYYDGSGFDGYGAMVVGRISYDWIGLNLTGYPTYTFNGVEHTGMISAFISMRVLTF